MLTGKMNTHSTFRTRQLYTTDEICKAYPKAPFCVEQEEAAHDNRLVLTHHKVGSLLTQSVLRSGLRSTGTVPFALIYDAYPRALPRRLVHFLRDLENLIISGYDYHKRGAPEDQPWCYYPMSAFGKGRNSSDEEFQPALKKTAEALQAQQLRYDKEVRNPAAYLLFRTHENFSSFKPVPMPGIGIPAVNQFKGLPPAGQTGYAYYLQGLSLESGLLAEMAAAHAEAPTMTSARTCRTSGSRNAASSCNQTRPQAPFTTAIRALISAIHPPIIPYQIPRRRCGSTPRTVQ